MSISIRKISANAFSILTSDAMNRATSFVVYTLVARKLGTFEFGQLSLALSLFYVFQVFAISGLKTLIVREVAKDRSKTREYFANGCLIVAFTSLASLAVLFAFVRLIRYPASTGLVILLLSVGLFPYAISSVCEAIFQAWERMSYIAWVNVPANLAKMVGAYLLLTWNPLLSAVIVVLLAAFFAVAGVEVLLVLRRFPAQKASVSIPFSLEAIRSASTFLGIDGTIAIESSLNMIFLSKLATEREVGLYSAATQLMVPLILVYQSIGQSIFPVMCRLIEPGYQSLKRITESAIEALLVLTLPAIAGIYFLGNWGLSLLYKNPAFQQAFPALRIMSWMLILQAISNVLGQVLVATHREKVTLRIVAVDVALNLVVGYPVILYFGLSGAAVMLLLTRLAGTIQHWIPVFRMFSGISLARITWKPIVAAACMAVFLAISPSFAGVLRGLSATLIYGATFLALVVLAARKAPSV